MGMVLALVAALRLGGPGPSATCLPLTGEGSDIDRIARIEAQLLPAVPLATDTGSQWSIHQRLRAHRIPGLSVAVVHDGRVAWVRSYGHRDAEISEPVTPCTMFQAGSISKPVATLALLSLVHAGAVALDTDVNHYLRRWRLPVSRFTRDSLVTLRRLLSHRGGISVRGFDGYTRGAPIPTLPQVLDGVAPANSAPIVVDTTPGAVVRYSGGGFTVAQLLLEDVTGESFDAFAHRRLFAPHGLTRTTYSAVHASTNGGDVASGHDTTGRPIVGRWRELPEMAAASLWSTPRELASLVLSVQAAVRGESGAVLDMALAQEMMTPQAPSQGLGVGLKGLPAYRFSHSGANEGFRAMLIGYLDRNDGIVVMTNGERGDALAMEYVRAVAREYGWLDLVPHVRHTIPLSSAMRERLEGRFALGPNWEIDVMERGDSLFVGPVGRRPLAALMDSDSTLFFPTMDGVELRVLERGEGHITAIEWKQGDRRVRGTRVTPPLALLNATVIDGTGSAPQRGVDLVIDGGRIVGMGKRGAVPIPPRAQRHDLSGQFVIPGLIDAHVHLATYDREPEVQDALLRAALLGGVTMVRDMGGNIDELRAIAARTSSDTVAASRLLYSAIMSGPGSMWFTDARSRYAAGRYAIGASPGVRLVDSATSVRDVVTAARATGARGLKLYGELPPALLVALSAEARRQGLAVWSHLSIGPGRPSDVLASGVAVVSHADMFIREHGEPPRATIGDTAAFRRRAEWYARVSPSDPIMQRLLAQMKDRGVALDATLHIMDPAGREMDAMSRTTREAVVRFAARMTQAAHRRRIPILVGSDDIGRGTPNVHHELQELTDRVGMTPLEALRSATFENARALGVADSVGTVVVGKVADLVILRDDPSRDIANTLTVERVLRGGVMHRRGSPLSPLPYLRMPRRVR
jgi:CubicO group peptidase (beta-lactamase class C family)